ncbi:MAG: cupin domain-containing protein [Gemmataceae bacterium]
MTAQELMGLLNLQPLPREGGYYRETYRSADTLPAAALPTRYGRDKAASTAIYYLLTPDTFSAMHRLPTDEIYHFYLGDPVEQLQLFPDGSGRVRLLGTDLRAGHAPQLVAPRGVWQGSRLLPGGTFALLGTTVAPGFDFNDYEHGDRETLIRQYADFAEKIRGLTAE